MKFARLGNKGKEIPAIIDKQNNFRDLSSIIEDFKPETLNFNTIQKIQSLDLSKKMDLLALKKIISKNGFHQQNISLISPKKKVPK